MTLFSEEKINMFASYTFKLKKQQQNINEEMKNVTKKK
jgi:hypothetical protein